MNPPAPLKKNGGGTAPTNEQETAGAGHWEDLPAPLGETHQPGEPGGSKGDSHKPTKVKKHPTKAGKSPSWQDHRRQTESPPPGNWETTDHSHLQNRKPHPQDPLAPSTSNRFQPGEAGGNTRKTHHHAGRITAPTTFCANQHPTKPENNTHRGPPRNGCGPPHPERRQARKRGRHRQPKGPLPGSVGPDRTLGEDWRGTTGPTQRHNKPQPARAGNHNRQTPSNHERPASDETHTGPHSTDAGHQWQAAAETHTEIPMPQTKPRQLRMRPSPHPDTNQKPRPRRIEAKPVPTQTHHQACNPNHTTHTTKRNQEKGR